MLVNTSLRQFALFDDNLLLLYMPSTFSYRTPRAWKGEKLSQRQTSNATWAVLHSRPQGRFAKTVLQFKKRCFISSFVFDDEYI